MEKQIIRDKKGRIVKGIAQDTNKNGTAGRPCEYCKDKDKIQKLTDDYLIECRTAKPAIIPYFEELVDRLDRMPEIVSEWRDAKNKDGSLEHPEFSKSIGKLKNLQKLKLFHRTIGRFNPTGAIFQLKVNHGLVEVSKNIQAGDSDNPVKYEIEIVEDKTNGKEKK
jgi:hypothetical protein